MKVRIIIILKKAKRTLSLVLALIMICSAMGVMTFAAENADPGRETSIAYEVPITAKIGTVYNTTYMDIAIDGVYSEVDEYSWIDVQSISFSGSWADRFSYTGPIYSLDRTTATIDIYCAEGIEIQHVYNLTITLQSTGNWRAVGWQYLDPFGPQQITIDP